MLLAAYAILFLPLAMVAIRTSLAQAPPVLDDVARSLGVGPLRSFLRVTLPHAAAGSARARRWCSSPSSPS